MDSTNKSSSRLEPAIIAVDGANTPNNTSNMRSVALLDINQSADVGNEDGLQVDVVKAEGGGVGSSSQQRNYARLSQEQIDQLEIVFQQNHCPDTKTKEELAERLGMTLDKVHVWFRTRRTRFNQIKRDEDQNQRVNTLIEEIKSLAKQNTSLSVQNTSLTEKILSLTEKVSSLAEKGISLYEKNSSLTEEKHRLESELAEIRAAHVPPVILPVPGLPQVSIELCRVCSPIFRDTTAAAGAHLGSQKGSASASNNPSTSIAKLCPDCLNALENMEAMVASFAQRQQRGDGGGGGATLMPPSSSSGARDSA